MSHFAFVNFIGRFLKHALTKIEKQIAQSGGSIKIWAGGDPLN